MIRINDEVFIDEADLEESFVLGTGPGGQHVNKTASTVQLRFDTARATGLDEEGLARLRKLAGQRMTDDGILVVEARESRSQHKNRVAAREKLVALIRSALEKPKPRKKTKPSASSVERRISEKKQRAQQKRQRRAVRTEDS